MSDTLVAEPSSLLDYLPSIYQGNEFLGRFLKVFEEIHSPLRESAAMLPSYFDTRIAPRAAVDYLASWVAAEVPDNVSERGRRALVRNAIALHRWRGTKRGLTDALRFATGEACTVHDATDGLAIGPGVALGPGARLQNAEAFVVTVRFECERDQVNPGVVRSILQAYSPAHIKHTILFAGE